ncbi:MAG TPA: MFS transporter [Flavobacteriales bacterium]|nr:MFS transporter [Flavobacteriales bacterium]HRO39488.1 MFS transporter [Flavobacteriales bacterium]HRP81284.1 MFS transporter [Flavobacteriales bacterium]
MQKGDPRLIRAWTMYDWANSAYSLTITSAIFPIYYAAITMVDGRDQVLETYELPATSLQSYTLSAGFLLVAAIAPLLSGIADHRGNKKNYLKFFCYLGAASCAGLFFFTYANLWIGLALFMLACVGFSGSLIFYDAFLPEIAEPEDHDRVSARGYAMGYIGSVVLLVFNLLMVMNPQWFGIPDRDGLPARLSFLSVGIWWAGWAQVTFRRLPNGKVPEGKRRNTLTAGYRELRRVWYEMVGIKRVRRFLMAFFVFNMGVQTVMYLAVTYAKQEIKEPDGSPIADSGLIASILLIQLLAAAGAMLFVRLSRRFGNLAALIIGLVIWTAICLAAWMIETTTSFYLLAAFVGLVMGGTQALSRSTYTKLLPETADHASYLSFYDVGFYLATVLGTLAFGLVNQLTGDLRNTVIAIGSFFVLGALLLLRVPREKRIAPVTDGTR